MASFDVCPEMNVRKEDTWLSCDSTVFCLFFVASSSFAKRNETKKNVQSPGWTSFRAFRFGPMSKAAILTRNPEDFVYYCLSKHNETSGDLWCRKQSKQTDLWYGIGNSFTCLPFLMRTMPLQQISCICVILTSFFYAHASNKFDSAKKCLLSTITYRKTHRRA